MLFSLYKYQSTEGLEERQGGFLLVLLNFALNIVNMLCALPAFLNLKKQVRAIYAVSFLTFCGGSLTVMLLLSGTYLFGNAENKNMSDFLSLGLPGVLFNIVLLYKFLGFRARIEHIA